MMACTGAACVWTCFMCMCVWTYSIYTQDVCAHHEFVPHKWNTANAPLGPTGSHFLPWVWQVICKKNKKNNPQQCSVSFTFGAGCGSLKPMCICRCQKISPNEFHLAGRWAHRTCFDHNARLSAPHHGRIMYSLLLYVQWLCSTTQCASSSKTTYVQHGWKVNSMMFIQLQPLWLLLLKHGQFHHRKANVSAVSLLRTSPEYTRGTVATCVMCHADVCSLGSKSSVLKEPSHKLSPFVSPLQKLKVLVLSLRAALKQKAS